jgi:hypothetical protein
MESGAPIESTASEPIEVELEQSVLVRALPGARFRSEARRSAAQAPRISLESGELIVKTRDGYTGPPLELATPEADVTITGSCVSVLAEVAGTCVCVAEGAVRARRRGDDAAEPIEPQHTWMCFAEPHAKYGACYRGAFHEPSGWLTPSEEAAHLAPLLELEAQEPFASASSMGER